jgi:hypothetical protein
LAPKFEIREIHFFLCFKIWDVTPSHFDIYVLQYLVWHEYEALL